MDQRNTRGADALRVDWREKAAVKWRLNAAVSQAYPKRVALVYESASPKLRLTWEWVSRAGFGPIEHRIRIQNLDARELWLSFQDSFRFSWSVRPEAALDHFYVEKGAGALCLPAHTSNDLRTDIDGSGPRAHMHIPRKTNSERSSRGCGRARGRSAERMVRRSRIQWAHPPGAGSHRPRIERRGLTSDPGPFRTRVLPGATFELERYSGGFQGGVESAGNVLRRWVREALTNPHAWQNPNYPLMVNNSWGTGMAVDDGLARRMIRDSAELGLEMFHIDAGWFRGVGDWYPDPHKLPRARRDRGRSP